MSKNLPEWQQFSDTKSSSIQAQANNLNTAKLSHQLVFCDLYFLIDESKLISEHSKITYIHVFGCVKRLYKPIIWWIHNTFLLFSFSSQSSNLDQTAKVKWVDVVPIKDGYLGMATNPLEPHIVVVSEVTRYPKTNVHTVNLMDDSECKYLTVCLNYVFD